jgi:Calmodulin-binding
MPVISDFKKLVDELNKMPMTAQTIKLRNRKMEIERELNRLEDSIRIFSRTKVYVKIELDED